MVMQPKIVRKPMTESTIFLFFATFVSVRRLSMYQVEYVHMLPMYQVVYVCRLLYIRHVHLEK
jgi:hypothetical protein